MMKTEINTEKRLYKIWLTTNESTSILTETITDEIKKFKSLEYTVVILRSGNGNIFRNTLELIKDNRMKAVKLKY